MDSKITVFPNSDQPGENAPDNQDKDFLAKIEKLEKNSDLFASYIHNGPSEDPLFAKRNAPEKREHFLVRHILANVADDLFVDPDKKENGQGKGHDLCNGESPPDIVYISKKGQKIRCRKQHK